MKVSKEAAALMRKLLVKPVLMPEWEIIKKHDVIAELEGKGWAKIVGSEKTGRFVANPGHCQCDEIHQLMILDMVADKRGIANADLMRWAEDIDDIGLSEAKRIVRELIDLGVLVWIDAEGQEVEPEEDEHEVMADVIEDDGTTVRFA